MTDTQFNLPVAISLLICIAALLMTKAEATDYQHNEFQTAYMLYQQVVSGSGGSAKKLAQRFERIVEQDPTDPFALVLLGSSHTMMGRDALMPWSKLKHTEKGLDEMSQALGLLKPEHETQKFEYMTVALKVKTIAAINFTEVPEFFGRHEEGFELIEAVLSDPSFLALPAPAKTYVYFYGVKSALSFSDVRQAEQWLDTLKALQVDDAYTAQAMALKASL